tara:strand:+ start:958 stop:1170 length:213 start_codon:yes stop_codon:yes gene_type:complete
MIRWVFAIFVLLTVFYPLLPFLKLFGVGKMPLDIIFKYKGIAFCIPLGSSVLLSAIVFLAAKLLHVYYEI